jgi:pimeloyl-ACP methyl ester carboxylesterase
MTNRQTLTTCSALALAALLLSSPAHARGGAAAAVLERLVREASSRGCEAALSTGGGSPSESAAICSVSALTRTELGDRIAHYSIVLQVGAGEHDRIRLHRVVKEILPWVPVPFQDAAFLLHGDAWPFETTYLAGFLPDSPPGTPSPALFLAQRGVDVWGMDFRWALVPPDVGDPSFVGAWDFGTDLGDAGVALQVASVLHLGRPGFHLAGYSRGGQIAYALSAAEADSGVPAWRRKVRGLIPIDILMKTDDESIRTFHCDEADAFRALVEAGDTVVDRSIIAVIADLALTDPDALSPIAPPFTNAGLALFLASSSSPTGLAPFFHSTGGVIDFGTLETALLYTTDEALFALQRALSPFQPRREIVDGDEIVCDEEEMPYDDGLGSISVPVLYVGAGGGFGEFGVYTTTLLASTDVTLHLVDLAPPAQRSLDFGHQDLLIADDALSLVWLPVLDWIRSR